jgi:hypothetical protein
LLRMTREERKKWHYEQIHKVINGIEYKQCSKCKEWKPMTEEYFYIWKYSTTDGYHSSCIECDKKDVLKRQHENPQKHRDESKKWYDNNKEHRLSVHKKWIKNNLKYWQNYIKQYIKDNPHRAKQYSENHREHDITTAEWNNCLIVFDYKCAYCGISQKEAKKRDKQNLHKDHVDSEGYNDLSNAAPACRSCNDKKWQHDMETWFREQEFFSEERLEFIKWWMNEGYKQYIEDKPPFKISRSRVYNEDGSYKMQHELWTVDEQRNMVECIYTGNSKKEMNIKLQELLSKEVV